MLRRKRNGEWHSGDLKKLERAAYKKGLLLTFYGPSGPLEDELELVLHTEDREGPSVLRYVKYPDYEVEVEDEEGGETYINTRISPWTYSFAEGLEPPIYIKNLDAPAHVSDEDLGTVIATTINMFEIPPERLPEMDEDWLEEFPG